MTASDWFGLGVVVVIVAVTAVFYDHGDRAYAKDKHERIPSPSGFSLVYRYIQLSTIGFGIATFAFPHPALLRLHDDAALSLSGSVAALFGLALFVIAKASLGRHYSPCFDSFVPESVVQVGVYGAVRHPIYTANLLMTASLAIAAGSVWLGLNFVLLAFYYSRAARVEEAALAARFAEYSDYLGRTGRFLPRWNAGIQS